MKLTSQTGFTWDGSYVVGGSDEGMVAWKAMASISFRNGLY
jgi:hypothetical protein